METASLEAGSASAEATLQTTSPVKATPTLQATPTVNATRTLQATPTLQATSRGKRSNDGQADFDSCFDVDDSTFDHQNLPRNKVIDENGATRHNVNDGGAKHAQVNVTNHASTSYVTHNVATNNSLTAAGVKRSFTDQDVIKHIQAVISQTNETNPVFENSLIGDRNANSEENGISDDKDHKSDNYDDRDNKKGSFNNKSKSDNRHHKNGSFNDDNKCGKCDDKDNKNGSFNENNKNANFSVKTADSQCLGAGFVAPIAITEAHIRLVKLRILLFELGVKVLESEMENCVRQKGFEGWQQWLSQNKDQVTRYQFYRTISSSVLPVPDPSSWDITFLAFLAQRCPAMELCNQKRKAADKIRQFRNTLSHDVTVEVDQETFEDLWRSISNCILSLAGDSNRVEEEIHQIRNLRVEIDGHQQQQQQQQQFSTPQQQRQLQQLSTKECDCSSGGGHCDQTPAPSGVGANNNNREFESKRLQIRISCWLCGNPRVYSLTLTEGAN